MRGHDHGSWCRHAATGPMRHARRPLVALGAGVAMLAAACTGAPVKVDPPNSPNAVVSSADRIRDGQTRLGGPTPCLESAYCAAGIGRVYGITLGSGGVELDTPSAVLEALVAGAIDIGALPRSAVEAGDSRLTVLGDDRQLQPADNVIPVISAGLSAAGGPALATAVDAVSAALRPNDLLAIERALAGGAPPELAAQSWLQASAPAVTAAPSGAPRVVVGARADDESQALAILYAGALSRAGWPAVVAPVGGGRPEELDALRLGRVGLVPDQATDLLQLLTGFTAVATADLERDVVLLRAALADRGLGALAPAPASPMMVFAVNRAVASALSVRTLSDLARATAARLPGAPAPPPLTPAEVAADSEYPLLAVPAGLGVGSSGLGVIALQQRLAALGYLHVPASGVYDEATRRAVAAVQTDQGLIGDGEDDPATARALAVAHASDHPSVVALPGDDDTVRVPASTPGGGRAGTLYLAFADGPSPVTNQVLDLLARGGAKATFFVSQDPAATAPETLRRIDSAGDAVGVTAEPHNGASALAEDSLLRTVSADQESVAAVLGRTPACLLAPYGASDGTTRARAVAAGLHPVVADIDPQDWRHPGSAVITTDVVASARPGSIILLHDGGGDRSQTITALSDMLTSLTGLGYGFGAIPGC